MGFYSHTFVLKASWECQTDIVNALIQAGVNLENNVDNRFTALMGGRLCSDVTNALVKAGADLNKQDEDGFTALMWGKIKKNSCRRAPYSFV
jgi:hypothetical protein